MKSPTVNIGQVMDLLSKLGGQVSWDEYQKQDLQKIIDSAVLSGAHFREFIRRGGRMPLDWIPLQCIASREINIAQGSWEETKTTASDLIGIGANQFCWNTNSLLMPCKPEHWKPRSTVIVSLLKLTDGVVHKERLLDFFNLLNVHPSTFLEAFAAIRGWQDKKVFDKGVFVLNAQCASSGGSDDVSITPSWLTHKRYHEVSVCGDIDDMDHFGNHQYFMVTHR